MWTWLTSSPDELLTGPRSWTEKLVVLPGFEVSQTRKKPVLDVGPVLCQLNHSNGKVLPKLHTRIHEPHADSDESL